MEKNGKFWPMVHESEDNSKFCLLKPYSTDSHDKPLLPWKSFHNSLRLMVHHFDAIHVVNNHLINLDLPSPNNISIQILYPPLPDESMLPWKQLLENEKYFPPIPHTRNQPSTTELITFLTLTTLDGNGNKIEKLIKDVNAVKLKQTSVSTAGTIYMDFTKDIEKLIVQLNDFKDFSSAKWEDLL